MCSGTVLLHRFEVNIGEVKMSQKYIFVAVSATPSFTGRMIRTLTSSRYNHIAISFCPDLSLCYSFARRYKNTPFCGGFVSESPKRYVQGGRVAGVRIYRIPVSDVEYEWAIAKCRSFAALGERSVYNNFSAVMSLVHTKVNVKNAYTCVEFAVEILGGFSATGYINKRKWYSVDSLKRQLEQFHVYSGRFPVDGADWGDDKFAQRLSFTEIVKEEISSNGRLLMNAIGRRS